MLKSLKIVIFKKKLKKGGDNKGKKERIKVLKN